MTRVTEGHLVRHYQGMKGGRDAALLDIAQDHALYLLHQAGLFGQGLVFKGGTALRKFRAGNAGRFSTDLDFAAPGEELALAALQALDGVELDGFSFGIQNLGDDGRRGDLRVETPFGSPLLGAKVELAHHKLRLDAERLEPMHLPIHDRYDFRLPSAPVIRVEEAVSEKLARYRRVSLARDLYDLQWFADFGCSRPTATWCGSDDLHWPQSDGANSDHHSQEDLPDGCCRHRKKGTEHDRPNTELDRADRARAAHRHGDVRRGWCTGTGR